MLIEAFDIVVAVIDILFIVFKMSFEILIVYKMYIWVNNVKDQSTFNNHVLVNWLLWWIYIGYKISMYRILVGTQVNDEFTWILNVCVARRYAKIIN